MIATAEQSTESESALALARVVEWVTKHGCASHVSSFGYSQFSKRPFVYFNGVEVMRVALRGLATATVKKTCSSTEWYTTVDGIDFRASKYGCSESPTTWEETL